MTVSITSSKGMDSEADATPVALSPSGLVLVCSGGQLELMCTTAGGFLEWDIFRVPVNGASPVNFGGRFINNQPGLPPSYQVIDSVFFNFSRVSAPDTLPLISRVVISPVSSSLNGTEMVCIDTVTMASLSTIIHVINSVSSKLFHKHHNNLL